MYAFRPTSRFSPFYVLYTCGPARGVAFRGWTPQVGPLGRARVANAMTLMSEVELKLASTLNEMPHLKQSLLEMASDGRATCRKSFDTYYDTADDKLSREGLVLLISERDHDYIQKVSAKQVSGMTPPIAGHWEDVIEGDRPNPRAPNSGAHLPMGLDHAELHARFTTRVRRTLFTLKPDASTQIEGALDEGEIRTADGNSVEPVSEVELLLKDGNPGALYGTALRLLEIAPLRIEIRSKAERGYHLLGAGTDARQTHAYLPSNLKPDLTVEESLQRIGRNCLSTVLLCEAAATADIPDGVHQMRVAIRRLRSVVATMRRMLPSEQYQWVTQTLKWMAGVLGPARNWDVFSSSLLASVRGVLLRGQELDEFCRVCEHARRSAHESANAAIRSSQYTAALLKLSQWFASRSWRNQPVSEQSALLMAPIETVASTLIGRRYKKVKKSADSFAQLTLERRHEFRIAVKKLRYTTEVFKDLFDNQRVAEFVQLLKPLQDDLGYINDVRVANELLTDLQISNAAIARAAGIVLGWHDRGLADTDRKLRKHVRRFREARPFW
jgi:triphosphatase